MHAVIMNTSQMIQIGIVGKAHGLSGAFYISGRNEPLPPEIKKIIIGPQGASQKSFAIQWQRTFSDRTAVKCSGVENRNDADSLKHQPLWILREWLQVADESEYCWADLIGKSVLDTEDQCVGHIVQVVNYGATDIVRIESETPKKLLLEIPFGKFYFNMDFKGSDTALRLCVTKDTFDDCWEPI
jgi:16S rRNA processing protein RimM